MSATPAIEIHDLHKSFGSVHALDGLNLTVEPGEIRGFLGLRRRDVPSV
jgi:ABC-2 type transport system ATP-binding protein